MTSRRFVSISPDQSFRKKEERIVRKFDLMEHLKGLAGRKRGTEFKKNKPKRVGKSLEEVKQRLYSGKESIGDDKLERPIARPVNVKGRLKCGVGGNTVVQRKSLTKPSTSGSENLTLEKLINQPKTVSIPRMHVAEVDGTGSLLNEKCFSVNQEVDGQQISSSQPFRDESISLLNSTFVVKDLTLGSASPTVLTPSNGENLKNIDKGFANGENYHLNFLDEDLWLQNINESLFNSPLDIEDMILGSTSTVLIPKDKEIVNNITEDLAIGSHSEEISHLVSHDDENKYSTLHIAVINGESSDICKILSAEEVLLDAQSCDGQTALHMAVKYGEGFITNLLLNYNADPTIKDCQGDTALHLSIRKMIDDDSLYECFKLLMESEHLGKMINVLNSQGLSPLHATAIYGAFHEAKCMIEKGANINLKDGTSGRTALFHAIERKDLKLMDLLIKNGADVHVKNMAGQTPYKAARIILELDIRRRGQKFAI